MAEWEKKSRKKKEKNLWESDGSGVPSWAQEVPWSDGSSAEEQFDAIKKDELMEQVETDLGSGAVDALSKMETTQVQELLTKLEGNLAGISDESRKNSGLELDVDGGEEKGGTTG